MHVVIRGIVVFFGLVILFLGLVFLIAGGTENVQVGAVMVLVSVLLLVLALMGDGLGSGDGYPARPGRPTAPRFGDTGIGSSEDMVCPYCGATVDEQDVTPKEDGLVG